MSHDEPDAEQREVSALVQHLIVDFAGDAAGPDHILQLVKEACGHSPKRSYLVLTVTCGLTAHLVRAVLADTLAVAAALGAEPVWGLGVEVKPDTDTSSLEYRAKHSAMQALTAACNDDRETVAALVMAICKSEEAVEGSVYALLALLRVFTQIYNTSEGREAAEFLGIAGLGPST
jgi:hypothetical protein